MLQKLDHLMAVKGINKSQLAAQSGIPKTTVYGWYKKGYEGIRRSTLRTLADFFGVSMEYLTNEDIGIDENIKIAPATDKVAEAMKLILVTKLNRDPTLEEAQAFERSVNFFCEEAKRTNRKVM